ncbi:aldehyde dehydrogenase family protein [Streptomyces sp. NPDC004539]|uniref:aldehyde dehydrogenase family protein n=1 Tax=Streptomyces sp. NPDC004539 TaxID=3154280 RepID=UPI0033B49EAF
MKILHVIDGAETGSVDGALYDDVDPVTRAPYAAVARGAALDAELAVAAARRAFDGGPWARTGLPERRRLLYRLAGLVEESAGEFARADGRDVGRARAGCDVPRAAECVRFAVDCVEDDARTPAGVVAGIVSWHTPLLNAVRIVAPALARGNTVVLKPSGDSPASAALLGRLALRAGIPDGVLNVVLGFGDVGAALTRNPAVDRIAFTGSRVTGRVVAMGAAVNLTPVALDLVERPSVIVCDDADLDAAVTGAAFDGSRFLVQERVYCAFLDRLAETARTLQVGDPADPLTVVGPLAGPAQYHKVAGLLMGGGRIVTGGLTGDDWFVRPTVLTELPADIDELPGPVVTVAPFAHEDEAVHAGTARTTTLFTRDPERALRVTGRLRSRDISVNRYAERTDTEFDKEFLTLRKTVRMAF